MALNAIGGKMRVWEIAKLADVESPTVLDYIRLIGQGHTVKSASSAVPIVMGLSIAKRLKTNKGLLCAQFN